jgi:hypothetical protein
MSGNRVGSKLRSVCAILNTSRLAGQEYSIDCQSAGIATYAMEHGFEVCQTSCDEAKSGLNLGRRALRNSHAF